jgi:single-stranded DNA-binding protein
VLLYRFNKQPRSVSFGRPAAAIPPIFGATVAVEGRLRRDKNQDVATMHHVSFVLAIEPVAMDKAVLGGSTQQGRMNRVTGTASYGHDAEGGRRAGHLLPASPRGLSVFERAVGVPTGATTNAPSK